MTITDTNAWGQVKFTASGLKESASGTVLTVNGINLIYEDLPYRPHVRPGDSLTFSYADQVSSSVSGEQFTLVDANASSPLTVTGPITVTGNYVTQYYLALETDPSGVTAPSGEGRYDEGTYAYIATDQYIDMIPDSSRYSFTQWTTTDMSELTDPTAVETAVLMDGPKTVTANYMLQYNVTFDASGVYNDWTDIVVNIDGNGYDVGNLPVSLWWDEGSLHSFAFYSPLTVDLGAARYVWIGTSGLSPALQSGSIMATASGIINGIYTLQYNVTFNRSGVQSDFAGAVVSIDGVNVRGIPISFWWGYGSSHSFSFKSPLPVTPNAKKYVWNNTSGLSDLQSDTITVSKSGTVTGNYLTQWNVTFVQTGLDSSAQGTVVTVNGTALSYSNFTYSTWVDNGSTVTYSYTQTVPSSTTGKQFNLSSVSGPAPGFTVTSAQTVTFNYVVQWNITFAQTGVENFNGTVVTIDESDHNVTRLPASFWWDNDSVHSFLYQSPLIAGTVQYVWNSTSGLSSLRSNNLTISDHGNVTGNYLTQSMLKVTAHCPVNILVISPTGSRVGYDGSSKSIINEISGATYTGSGTDPQVITIPSPAPGTYTVEVYGTGTGSYTITVDFIAENGSTTSTITWTGTTSPGKLDENTVQLDEQGKVVPEFSSVAVLLLFMVAALCAAIVCKKKLITGKHKRVQPHDLTRTTEGT
jgi:hypothetical protein